MSPLSPAGHLMEHVHRAVAVSTIFSSAVIPIVSAFLSPPFSRGGDYHGADECQSESDIKYGRRDKQHDGRKQRDDRDEPCMMKNVVKDEEQKRCSDYRKTAVKRIGEAKVMPEDEAPSSQQKRQGSNSYHDQSSPFDVSLH